MATDPKKPLGFSMGSITGPHIQVAIADDTPPDKLVLLAKYCLQRAGCRAALPDEIAKARGTVQRRQRILHPPPTTFPDPHLEALWHHAASWGTHWWITASPVIDRLLAHAHSDNDDANWSHVQHVLDLAGQAFLQHVTGLAPHAPHEDLALFRHAQVLPAYSADLIAHAVHIGMEQYAAQHLHKALPWRAVLTAVEQAAIRYAQRAAGAVLQPILAGVQARVARLLLQREQQIVRQRVPEALAQRQSPRRLASVLAEDVGNWQRDWERVARTELQDAAHHGAMATLIAQHPSNQSVAPDGTMQPVEHPVPPPIQIFRLPADTACERCVELFTNTDGTPHLYDIQTVLTNPSNYGVPAEQWVAQIATVHPNCLCSPWQTYIAALHGPLFASMRQSTAPLNKATPLKPGQRWVTMHGRHVLLQETASGQTHIVNGPLAGQILPARSPVSKTPRTKKPSKKDTKNPQTHWTRMATPAQREKMMRDKGEHEAAMHAHFDHDNVPEAITKAIAEAVPLDTVIDADTTIAPAYYLSSKIPAASRIAMSAFPTEEFESATWRHEFGHHIDYYMEHAVGEKFQAKPASRHDAPALAADGADLVARITPFEERDEEKRIAARLFEEMYDAIEAGEDEDAVRKRVFARAGFSPEEFDRLFPMGWKNSALRGFLAGLETRNLAHLMQMEPEEQGDISMFYDFIGAVTNKGIELPFGHTREYFDSGEQTEAPGYTARHTTEAFANWFCLQASRQSFWRLLLARLAPQTHAAFQKRVDAWLAQSEDPYAKST